MTCPVCNDESSLNSKYEEFCKGCGKLFNSCNCEIRPEKVSVIIPAYNAENFINDAIENVLRQTYSNIEIIVVDDGSTDKTLLKLLKDPLSKKIKIIEKANGGVGSALNAGIKVMDGKWFKWLSADDKLDLNCIEEMMKEIKLVKNNTDKIFYTNYDIIDENGEITDTYIEEDRNGLPYLDKCAILLNNYYGNATTCIIHKSVFERVGLFDESIKNGDDYDFWLRCLFIHHIELHLIPKTLASYRIHKNQLTNRRGSELFKTVKAIREKNLQWLAPQFKKLVLAKAKSISDLSFKVKLRRKLRDITFTLMPNKFNNKLLSEYTKRK